ncbi:MAG: tRNA adenosine(34) deaminase TadA [Elusimicrobia bacterium]|nr:tRNA adenosine(34) deaminase TadA [Elusimicrobiota bacterium]
MNDIFFIKEALKEAKKAVKSGEVPVGCVIVKDGKIISRAHNLTIRKNDPTAHAEILAIKKAAQKTGNYRLTNCEMYVTIEPCPMCAGAAIWSRMKKIIFGVCDEKSGACGSVVNIMDNKKLNHQMKIKGGVLSNECADLMKNFFRKRR